MSTYLEKRAGTRLTSRPTRSNQITWRQEQPTNSQAKYVRSVRFEVIKAV